MTVTQALQLAVQTLQQMKTENPFIEAELLLSYVVERSRTQIYTEPEKKLTGAEIKKLRYLLWRRLNHEPIQYILKQCEFYGLAFYVDYGVLIPRPETEILVDEAIRFSRSLHQHKEQLRIADVGTGSGVIAICLALALPNAKIYATDISTSALRIARINCVRHKVDERIELLQGNLLEPLTQPVDIVVANLPYVKESEFANLAPEITRFEPDIALLGGESGLEKIRQLVKQIPGRLNQDGGFLLEIGEGQGETVRSMVRNYFPQATIHLIPDLSGIDRVVRVEMRNKCSVLHPSELTRSRLQSESRFA